MIFLFDHSCRVSVASAPSTFSPFSAALQPAVAAVRDYVQTQSVNMDETGWRQARQRAWLWVAVAEYLTLFEIVDSRGAPAARQLLRELGDRIVTTDHYSAYSWQPLYRPQLC